MRLNIIFIDNNRQRNTEYHNTPIAYTYILNMNTVVYQTSTPLWLVRQCLIRRAVQLNSISSLCLTKLDVLDDMEPVKICTAYKLTDTQLNNLPLNPGDLAQCVPIYEEHPGWKISTTPIKELSKLPVNAQNYLRRIKELTGVPITIISTGPDREETIALEKIV